MPIQGLDLYHWRHYATAPLAESQYGKYPICHHATLWVTGFSGEGDSWSSALRSMADLFSCSFWRSLQMSTPHSSAVLGMGVGLLCN